MPEPTTLGRRYSPGIDGLRALAVLGVIAYRVAGTYLPGGLLGLSILFTLSGYLLTDLVLDHVGPPEFRIETFWVERARRLLPGLLVMLASVMAWMTVVGRSQTSEYRLGAASSLLHVNNWWVILRKAPAFARGEATSPFGALWPVSIAVQYALLLPVLLVLAMRWIRERDGARTRPRLAALLLVLAAVSFDVMGVLFESGSDPRRLALGTDTRAGEFLVGAALAAVWPCRRLSATLSLRTRRSIDALGIAGLLAIGVVYVISHSDSPWMYRGGLALLAVGVACVVAAVVHPACRLGGWLGATPLHWIGARSYGIFLWHFPIVMLTTQQGRNPQWWKAVLQLAVTFTVAELSWRWIEDPIRRGGLAGLRARLSSVPDAGETPELSPRAWVALGVTIGVLAVGLAGTIGAHTRSDEQGTDPAEMARAMVVPTTLAAVVPTVPDTIVPLDLEPTSAATPAATTTEGAMSSCDAVVHLGDVTSLGLMSAADLPDEATRLDAQYTRVGVKVQHFEVAAGRTILQSFRRNASASMAASTWRETGFNGCWVVALGAFDAAEAARTDPQGYDRRIDTLMRIIGANPVLWINARTTVTAGWMSTANMVPWNERLLVACDRYPNLRVYDWAHDAQDSWFGRDRVQNTPEGNVVKARNIADALVEAFPRRAASVSAVTTPQGSRDCVIRLR